MSRPDADGRPVSTAVWVCEYPYRTIRATGPREEDCSGCPVWREIGRARRRSDGDRTTDDIERLERLLRA